MVLVGFALSSLPDVAIAQTPTDAVSPDRRNRIDVTMDGGKLRFAVTRDGKAVLAPSPVGLFTDQGALGGDGVEVAGTDRTAVNDVYRPVVGKASQVRDNYNQLTLHLLRKRDGVRFDLIVRAYAEGVAFRFVVPAQDRFKSLDVYWETTGLYFPADYGCWGANPGNYVNSHEFEFDSVQASKMRNFHLYDAPLLCATGKGTTFAIAESDKRDYAGAYLRGRSDGGLGVNISLTTRPDNAQDGAGFKTAVHASLLEGPLNTAWRVVMLGDTAGDLIPSNLIHLLAEPSRIADTSWIKPGKSAWDWWNGWAVDVPDAGVNTATFKNYIDFAQKMGLEYTLIDEGWYKGSFEGPAPADVTVPKPEVDIPGVVKYGAERGVGVWVWLQWKQLERQLDAAIPLYASWGIKGIKVDFLDRNDQEMVAFYHRLLKKAAEHHLMVDLHGAYPPDGLARTWPNFVTQEGVLGVEYNKFGTRITASHTVTLPFTRGLLGPMDYTPGGFRALPPAEFATQVRSPRPYVMTTRGHGMAMYLVYDSPFVMLSDNPESYVAADGTRKEGADFLRDVPASWDETRFLAEDRPVRRGGPAQGQNLVRRRDDERDRWQNHRPALVPEKRQRQLAGEGLAGWRHHEQPAEPLHARRKRTVALAYPSARGRWSGDPEL